MTLAKVDIGAETSPLASSVIDAVREVAGPGRLVLHEPLFAGNESRYLEECLRSTFVSSIGPFVDRFEKELAAFTGAKYAVAAVNGTAALHIALILAGVRASDEVLVPTLTFAATTNAIAYCGAIPHFVDSEERTLGVDAASLRAYLREHAVCRDGACLNISTGRRIRAIVPMHVFGHPVDLDAIVDLAREFGLEIVEDAAESLGSYYQGRHTGTFGRVGTLSFNGNKTITTGGGGAILCNDAALARRAKHLTTTAKIEHRWEYRHDELGYNYRMPNINAALGCAQLEQLPTLLAAKRRLYERYRAAFAPIRGLQLFSEPAACQSNYWLQTLLLDRNLENQRDSILAATNDAGVGTRPAWVLNHELPAFAESPRMPLGVADSLAKRIINIPSSAQLGLEV
jgi:perosamine synthetase